MQTLFEYDEKMSDDWRRIEREVHFALLFPAVKEEERRDNTSLCPADWADCDNRRWVWTDAALHSDQGPHELSPPHAMQSSWLYQQGISLSCTSKRNRSSYYKRIHMVRMDESRITPRNRWDRLKGISELAKSRVALCFHWSGII